jgi:hypothetical protein
MLGNTWRFAWCKPTGCTSALAVKQPGKMPGCLPGWYCASEIATFTLGLILLEIKMWEGEAGQAIIHFVQPAEA